MEGKLPKKWTGQILRPALEEISRLCTLETARFNTIMPRDQYPTNEEEADAFVKGRIRLWLTNITDQVETIEETLG